MKKTVIALAALASVLFAISCQKENGPETKELSPMTICAVSEGIGATGTKTEMAYKYDILWCDKDQILVKNASNSAIFKLVGGAGTTKGTFTCDKSPFTAGETVEAYYPESIVSGADLIWPANQANSQTVPMYCKNTLSATETQTFPFASLGSVLQLNFNSTTADIVLKSIEVKADEAMSGKFTVNNNGQAVITQQEGDKPGITLDLGDGGVALGTSAKKFNIAVPAGTYTNLTVILTAISGKRCTKHATVPQTIQYNTVNTLATSGDFIVPVESVSLNKNEKALYVGEYETLTATVLPENAENKNVTWGSSAPSVASVDQNGKVTATGAGTATITVTTKDGNKTASCEVTVSSLPAGALPGVFSISGDDGTTVKKIHFSKGNLYYDSSLFKFENNQYDTPDEGSWDSNHVSHFYWSKTGSVTFGEDYYDEDTSIGDLFFTNAEGFSVNVEGAAKTGWRALSIKEWQYMFNTRTMKNGKDRYTLNITYGGMSGLVLYPDDYSGSVLAPGINYTNENFPQDCVFLPVAGCRNGSSVDLVGDNGYYWSSSLFNKDQVCSVLLGSVLVDLSDRELRNHGSSVRLITECQ